MYTGLSSILVEPNRMYYLRPECSVRRLPPSWVVPAYRKRVLVLRNPKAGPHDRTKLFAAAMRMLKAEGYKLDAFCDIAAFEEAVEDALRQDQLRCVVPAGGDGTCTLVASLVPPHVPLAPLPLGNENVMAHWFGYRRRPDLLVRAICAGRAVTVDAGEVNGRLFLFVLTCGFDAEVVHQTHRHRRGHAGHTAYVGPLLRTLTRYRFPPIYVKPLHQQEGCQANGGLVEPWAAPWVFVFNVPCYAMGIPICLDADPADGLLDVCTFPPTSVPGSLYYLSQVLLKRHPGKPGVRHERLAALELSSHVPIWYQCDGDPVGQLPATVRLVPERWSILLPDGGGG